MTCRPLVLVVEDDAAIRMGVVDALQASGYDTREAGDVAAGLELSIELECDLVLLDLVLPGEARSRVGDQPVCDGLDILRELRNLRPTLPAIILTARGEENDRVRGLTLGADDYVVKPFSLRELLARVEAVLRRSAERPSDLPELMFPGGVADLSRMRLRFDDGAELDLSEREGELLRYLACRAGRPISRDELLANVWRLNPTGLETRAIDMHVARLREKLRDDAKQPVVLVTVRGKGYMFVSTTPADSTADATADSTADAREPSP